MTKNINKKPTVSIGIPAYNEEANIVYLLSSIIQQGQNGFELLEIIVISDGSTDNTVTEAHKLSNSFITIVDKKENTGCAGTQNEICEKARGDILVMLDADVILCGKDFLQKIIEPIVDDTNADLVGASLKAMPGKTFYEKIIAHSHKMKQYLFEGISNGNNIYLCRGTARAFKKKLYKQICWPVPQHGEDAYSYLFAVSNGFKFAYQPDAKAIFRSPSNWHDHKMQSKRFMDGQKILKNDFNPRLVKQSYYIPIKNMVKTFLVFILHNPLYTMFFAFIYLYVQYLAKDSNMNHAMWESSKSSKQIL